ncbi:MAG TPA: T9SS type A sorting domain-containing protein [Flavobacteriales bacterium]|nr:T9SS type A sorting domain-containing protein [Flavobacteriales bacterium]
MKTFYILNQNIRKRKSMFFSSLLIIVFFGFTNYCKSQIDGGGNLKSSERSPVDKDNYSCDCWINLDNPAKAQNVTDAARAHPNVFVITQKCDDNCTTQDKCAYTVLGSKARIGNCVPNGSKRTKQLSLEELMEFYNDEQTILISSLELGTSYPNPAKDFVAIPTKASEEILFAEVQVLNMMGQVITQSNHNGNGLTEMGVAVNVTELSNGLYFCRVTINNALTGVTRIAVQR